MRQWPPMESKSGKLSGRGLQLFSNTIGRVPGFRPECNRGQMAGTRNYRLLTGMGI